MALHPGSHSGGAPPGMEAILAAMQGQGGAGASPLPPPPGSAVASAFGASPDPFAEQPGIPDPRASVPTIPAGSAVPQIDIAAALRSGGVGAEEILELIAMLAGLGEAPQGAAPPGAEVAQAFAEGGPGGGALPPGVI